MKQSAQAALLGTLLTETALLLGTLVTGSLTARLLLPEGRGALAAILYWPQLLAGIGLLSVHEATTYRVGSRPDTASSTRASSLCILMALAGVRAIPAPAQPSSESNLLAAVLVAGGAALVLTGLGSGGVLQGAALVVLGVAVGLPAFRRLVPPGTLTARPGMPATVLVRGVLTFAFFCGDAYVPYALVTVRGLSTTVAGLALTAATLTWTTASWIQARRLEVVGARRLVAFGLVAVALGSLAMLLVLSPSVPAAVGIACWAVAGFGIGLAYSPLSVVTLAEATAGQEGRATSSLQLSDMLGTALGAGIGGVLVALGVAIADSDTAGLVAVYLLGALVAGAGVLLSRRVPGRTAVA